MPSLRVSSLALFVSIAATSAAGANVIIVAPGGGDFAQIQPAVDAAVDRDTILVRAGSYSGFVVGNKALSIVADTGAAVLVTGSVGVLGLGSARDVVIAGLEMRGPNHGSENLEVNPTAGVGFYVVDSVGSVRLQGCRATGGTGTDVECWGVSGPAGRGAFLGNASDVAFEACQLTGAAAQYNAYCWTGMAGRGGDGLVSRQSSVALYDCTLTGGRGGIQGAGGNGGHGARFYGTGGAFAASSTFQGGNGGWSNTCDDPFAPPYLGTGDGGNGGSGIRIESPAQIQLLANTLAGGTGALGTCSGSDGYDGGGLSDASGGHVFTFNVPARTLSVATPVREGTSVPITVHGVAGDEAFLISALGTAFQPVPSWRGIVIPASSTPLKTMFLGTIPASGTLAASLSLPDLGPGVLARTVYVQVRVRDAAQTTVLGSFAAVTVLDSAY